METGFRFRFSYRYCNSSSLCVGLRSQHVVSVYVLLHFVLYALLVILCLSFVLTFVLFCFVSIRFEPFVFWSFMSSIGWVRALLPSRTRVFVLTVICLSLPLYLPFSRTHCCWSADNLLHRLCQKRSCALNLPEHECLNSGWGCMRRQHLRIASVGNSSSKPLQQQQQQQLLW